MLVNEISLYYDARSKKKHKKRIMRLQIFIVNYGSLRKGSSSVHWHNKVWNLYVKENLAAIVINVFFISSRVVLTLAVSVVSGSSAFTE